MSDLFDQIEAARAALADQIPVTPTIGVVLGSGLGALADDVDGVTIPYSAIPHFPASTVHGHRGELAVGTLAGAAVAVMRGRFHFYEGYDMRQVTFPIRVMRALGCEVLILTNACGGLHPEWPAGNLMLIKDHIFMPGLAGNTPLRGPNDDRLGPRFPAMVGCYDPELRDLARRVAAEQGVTLREGTYFMVAGPAFESSGELRLASAFADAVGMSTAPEAMVARHGGMRVLGISLITNQALPDGSPANHEEVLAAGEAAKPMFGGLLKGILAGL